MRNEVKADIRARITLTNRDMVLSGYRPAHLIGDYLTTGVQSFIDTDSLKKGECTEGYITFVSPEAYPHSLKIGDTISFQEGSTITGYIEVIEIYNKLLQA